MIYVVGVAVRPCGILNLRILKSIRREARKRDGLYGNPTVVI